jgi:hypothetical protein
MGVGMVTVHGIDARWRDTATRVTGPSTKSIFGLSSRIVPACFEEKPEKAIHFTIAAVRRKLQPMFDTPEPHCHCSATLKMAET